MVSLELRLETKSLRSSNQRMREELQKYEAYVEEQNQQQGEYAPPTPPIERWTQLIVRQRDSSAFSKFWREVDGGQDARLGSGRATWRELAS